MLMAAARSAAHCSQYSEVATVAGKAGKRITANDDQKRKGYVAATLFLVAVSVPAIAGPPRGWMLLLALAVAVPFGILAAVAMMEADDDV